MMWHASNGNLRPTLRTLFSLGLIAALAGSCTTQDNQTASVGATGGGSIESYSDADLTLPMCTAEFDPEVGDPDVPAKLGGPGFTGEGWTTASEYPLMGNPDAPRGGTARMVIYDWPATLRMCGTGWNTYVNYMIRDMCYESLLGSHPVTLETLPGLASHWQISEDQMTYRFRINPKARWSDGQEVTAEDVVATFKLKTDPGVQEPSAAIQLGKMETPKAISKYIVEVKAKELNWRNFLLISGIGIFPAHEISEIDGKTYLDKYQFDYTASTGPYMVKKEDIVKGSSITLTRRDDYWAEDDCISRGLWNIDRIKFVVVKDQSLAFEKLKKGELDIYRVPKAQWWAEEVDKIDGIQRGIIQKRKVYTDAPIGTSGLAINTRRPPLDNLNVRLAFCYLLNRDLMIEKLYFDEYEPLYSTYQGGVYQNPGNEPIPYDPEKAVGLLEEAGWSERDGEGILVKDGERLQFEIQYESKLSERSLTIFQEDCLRAGIKIDLQLLNRSTRWKNLMARKFDITSTAWGATIYPNPYHNLSSEMAVANDNNNITGFADARVDSIIEIYHAEFDIQERIRLIREIDGIVYNQHHYVMEWYNPSQRFLYWNKFGHPNWYISRLLDFDNALYSWWVDPEKERMAEAGKTDPTVTMPIGPTEIHFWEAWNRLTERTSASLLDSDNQSTP